MNQKNLFALWGGMFILCAAMGFIPEPTGALRVLMIALAVISFLPPALLLYRAARERDTGTLRLIRNLAALSLTVTAAAISANFLCLMAPEAVGNVLYFILVIVSSPMVCGQYWVLSLFLWACLLMGSLSVLRKNQTKSP